MNTVAIIFDNYGPYHLARLEAASRVCNLFAIEVAGKSGTYAWDRPVSAGDRAQVTLIEKGASDAVSNSELRRRLFAALERSNCSAVVIPGWASPAAWSAMAWCIERNVSMICMSESTAWDEPRSAWKEEIKRRLVGLFSSALVGGERHRDYLVQLGLHADKIFLGYDAVDNAYFETRSREVLSTADDTRERLDLHWNYFLASARFVEKKNLFRLLEAYAKYRSMSEDRWKLVLLGDGELRPELEAKRDQLGLTPHVRMPGFLQYGELPTYYSLAGAFIHASTIEPWGLVVNEAMNCGLPILVSDKCGCAAELVRDGTNGFLFDPTDVTQMAAEMRKVASPGFPRAKFGEASRHIVAEWGSVRFAQGLQEAVEAAGKSVLRPTGMVERTLLRMLMVR